MQASLGQSKSAGEKIGPSQTLIPSASPWAYNTNLSASQVLFDGGKSFADVRTMKANVASAQASENAQDFNIALNVKTQYNSILAAQESEAAGRAQLAVAQTQLDVSIAKVNAGAANVADSLNSVVLVGNAQIAILTAQQSLKAASAALTHLVGTDYLVTASPADTLEPPRTDLDSAALMAWALDGPTIRQAQAQFNAANATERSAKTGYLPTVNANASVRRQWTECLWTWLKSLSVQSLDLTQLELSDLQSIRPRDERRQCSDPGGKRSGVDQGCKACRTANDHHADRRDPERRRKDRRCSCSSIRASEEALRVNHSATNLAPGSSLTCSLLSRVS